MNKRTEKARRRRLAKKSQILHNFHGAEALEDRRLLSVSPHDNFIATEAADNGPDQQTEIVQQMITKVPAGANQALAVMANWTEEPDLQIEIKLDNNGNGIFEASEIFTTAGTAHNLSTIADPTGGTSPVNNIHPQGFPGADGEGAYSVGYSCALTDQDDCGFPTSTPGVDAVNSAVYIHPIGSSPIDRQVMVTLSGGQTTDIMASIGTYSNVAQFDPVNSGNAYEAGNGTIDFGGSFSQPANNGANDEGDAFTSGPAGNVVNRYPSTVPGTSITGGAAGNVFLDAVHVRFVNGSGTSELYPTGNSIAPGDSQTAIPTGQTGGNFTSSGARSSGGASSSSDGSFTWDFTDTVETEGARFFSHAAVAVRTVDGTVDYDYGDAPDQYGTTLAEDGPRHATTDANGDALDGPYFGATAPDVETDGQPSGDDALESVTPPATPAFVDDEDGLGDYANDGAADSVTALFVSDPMNTSAATVSLDVQGVSADAPGYVSGWIDWNEDGDFDDANEQFAAGVAVTTSGLRDFSVTIPAGMGADMVEDTDDDVTTSGSTYMRIRIHSDPCDTGEALDPTGHANDGEVEDYEVNVLQGSSLHGTKYEDVNGDGTADEDVVMPNAAEGDVNGVVIRLQTRVGGTWTSVTDLLGNVVEDVETDASGNYWFSYLAPGEYRVRERLGLTDINDDDVDDNDQGLVQVSNGDFPTNHVVDLGDLVDPGVLDGPGGPEAVLSFEGEKIENLDFLNYVEGSIHGVKFHDLDGDGEFDFPTEQGVEEVTFELFKFVATHTYDYTFFTGAADASYKTYEWEFVTSTLSMEHGEFWFTGLEPGVYAVRENISETKWTQSTAQPQGDPDSQVTPPTGTVNAALVGEAFLGSLGDDPDLAATGAITINSRDELQWDDNTEYTVTPYAGEAYNRPLDTNDNGLIDQAEVDAINEATALKNGSAAYDSDSGPSSLIFGNYLAPRITGFKLQDMDADGDGDVTYSGVVFELYLDTNEDGELDPGDTLVTTKTSGHTGEAGEFEFSGLLPATSYLVAEAVPSGNIADQITHDPKVYAVTTVSGGDYDAGFWVNYVYGSIHGVKFEDTDGDGVFDFTGSEDSELGLTGVTFELYKFVDTHTYKYDFNTTKPAVTYTTYEWEFVTSTTSMDHGEFWFTGLTPGLYSVRENIEGTDWIQSTDQPQGDPDSQLSLPSDPDAAEVTAAFDGTFLGEEPTTANAFFIISGQEWQWDSDTTFENDPYLGHAYQRPMDTDGNGLISDAERQAAIDATTLKSGVLRNTGETSLIFGNYKLASVSGVKLETGTAAGDVGFEGIEFELYVDTNSNGSVDDGTTPVKATTDADGNFEFTGLIPGTSYIVVEKSDQSLDPAADDQLSDDNRLYAFTAASGEEYDAGTWKNYVYGSIHGVKFEDLDADGSFDFEDGEKGLTGVRFDLWKFDGTSTYTYDFNTTKPAVTYTTYEWDFVTSTYSMDHGEFWFTGLEPGVYVVREAISSGWNLSTGQPTNNPDTELSGLPSSPTASEVEDAFDGTYLGDNPDETSTGAFTIYSRDELQWDDDSKFTDDPYEGEAYNRPMDLDDSGLIEQDEIDAINNGTSLKNGSAAYDSPGPDSLIFGNYEFGRLTGTKLVDTNGDGTGDAGFEGIEFELLSDPEGDGTYSLADETTTHPNGFFSFSGLTPGVSYRVREKSDQSLDPTSPDEQLTHDSKTEDYVLESGETKDLGNWVNYVYGSIHGFKFLDSDANGEWDYEDEVALEGIKFDLYKYNGSTPHSYDLFSGAEVSITTYEWTLVGSEYSDVHGEFWFTGLIPGMTYTVREDLSGTDYLQTTDQATGNPTSVFDPDSVDANGDGVYTQAEIEAATSVFLGDPSTTSSFTMASGTTFQWDSDTTYESLEDYEGDAYNRPMDLNGDGLIDSDERQAADDSTSLITTVNTTSDLMFGNKFDTGTIRGFKFNDLDADGIWDNIPSTEYIPGSSEPGIEGILIALEDSDGNLVTLADGSDALTITDENGEFVFTEVIPGQDVTIVEYLDDVRSDSNNNGIADGLEGMYQTTESETVNLDAGQTLTWTADSLIIGNAITGSIHGFKFEDFDLDGIYNPDAHWPDEPMEWAVFELYDADGALVDTQMTNIDGEFAFENLPVGTYTVVERMDLTDRNDLVGPGTNGNPGPPDGRPDGNGIVDSLEGLGATTPTSWTITIDSGEEYVWAPGAANLAQVNTVDPDAASAGSDVSNFYPNVVLEEEFADFSTATTDIGPVSAIVPVSFASTGELVFGHGSADDFAMDEFNFPTVGGDQSHVFRASFNVDVKSVSLTVIGIDSADQGLVVAFDSDGMQLDYQTSAVVGDGETSTITVTALPGTSIAYIEAGGNQFHTSTGSTVGLANLTYETFPLKHEVLAGSNLMFGNYYAGAVHGTKTHEDTGEGVPNIELTLSNGTYEYTTTTDADGNYSFLDVVPGIYTLSETPSAALLTGFDPFPVHVDYGTVHVSETGLGTPYEGLQSELVTPSLAITNLIAGSIHGIKVHEGTGVPAPGITFELRTMGGDLVASATTGTDGTFEFDGLTPANYLLVEIDTGQPLIGPLASIIVDVNSGEEHVYTAGAAGTLDPGQFEVTNSKLVVENELEGSVHGQVLNAMGVGLPGISVALTDTDTIVYTTTDADGFYEFDEVAPGTYDVTPLNTGELLGPASAQITISSGEEETSYTGVDLDPGQYETINPELLFQEAAVVTPPVVTEVKVSSTFWTDASNTNNFVDVVDPSEGLGYELPTGVDQTKPLPWRNLNTVYVEFNEDVVPPNGNWAGAVTLWQTASGSTTSLPVVLSGVSYDPTNYRLTLSTNGLLDDGHYLVAVDDTVTDTTGVALDGDFVNGAPRTSTSAATAGQALPSGDGTAGNKFEFVFSVQHGDASQSSFVDVTDLNRLGIAFGSTAGNVSPSSNFNIFADFNGSGSVDVTDLQILAANFGDIDLLTTPVPTNPLFLMADTQATKAVDSLFATSPFDSDDEDEADEFDSIATDVAQWNTQREGRIV